MYNLIAVTSRNLCDGDFLEQVKRLVACDIPEIILREKDVNPREYAILAEKVLEICRNSRTQCILHGFVDVAICLQAPAIHLPLPVAEKEREKLHHFQTLGISTHSLEQVRKAEQLGASYVTYGHVFSTDCKKDVPPRGIASLEEICRSTELPVYAIGGIQKDNLQTVMQAGASGACVMSLAMRAKEEEIRELVE